MSSLGIVENLENFIQIGLMWDELPDVVCDLDLQCVLLNEIGQIEDAVYYNQLTSKIASIQHSGDSLGEKEGFDEVITIDLSSCKFMIKYVSVLICAYKGEPLTRIESCNLKVIQSKTPFTNADDYVKDRKGKVIHEIQAGAVKQTGNSILACVFERSFEGKWRMAQLEEVGDGKNFMDNESLIKRGLVKGLEFDEAVFSECKNWSGGKSFSLDKKSPLLIPPIIKSIAVGLGWDTYCDIDASILLFDQSGACLENIYFGNKLSTNGSVVHCGDNLTGAGDGDDEVVKINLVNIPNNVLSIWAVINVYTNGKLFDDVSGAYCRLFVLPGDENKQIAGSEFCKFNLSQNKDHISNGCIMCSITRAQDGCWSISPKGLYTQNTKTSREMTAIISNVMKNDFSQAKTIEQIYETNPRMKQLAQQNSVKLELEKMAAQEKLKQQEMLRPRLVEVEIVSGSGLTPFSNGYSDVYVKVFVNKQKFSQTLVVKKSLNPTWNYKTSLHIANGDLLRFEIFHSATFFDDFMGECFIQFNDAPKSNTTTLAVLNKHHQPSSKFTGTLTVNTILKQ